MAAVKQIRGKAKRRASKGQERPQSKSPLDTAKAYEVIWQQVAPVFEAARPFHNPEFIYLVGEEDGGPVKIGISKDPIKRVRSMQTGNSRRLRIEYVLVGDKLTERLLHEFWWEFAIPSAGHRLRAANPHKAIPRAAGTEWFKPEIRDQLGPIVETAAEYQVECLTDLIQNPDPDAGFLELEQIIRLAHREHDFVFVERERPRFLAPTGGKH